MSDEAPRPDGPEQTQETPAGHAPNALRVIDWQTARARIPGGEEGVVELTAMMLEECPAMLSALKEGLAAENAGRVRIDAHTLGGSARHFAAREVAAAAFAIEALARDGDLRGANQALPDLERKLARLSAALAKGPPPLEAGNPPSGEVPRDRLGKRLHDSDGGDARLQGEQT